MAIQSPKPSPVQAAFQSVSGRLLLAPGEFVRYAARLDRKTLAWGALAMALTAVVGALFGVVA